MRILSWSKFYKEWNTFTRRILFTGTSRYVRLRHACSVFPRFWGFFFWASGSFLRLMQIRSDNYCYGGCLLVVLSHLGGLFMFVRGRFNYGVVADLLIRWLRFSAAVFVSGWSHFSTSVAEDYRSPNIDAHVLCMRRRVWSAANHRPGKINYANSNFLWRASELQCSCNGATGQYDNIFLNSDLNSDKGTSEASQHS